VPGANANTQIANLNEENLRRILAAIKTLHERVVGDEQAWERLDKRSNAAAARQAAELRELGKQVKAYFKSKNQDPDGCVSDPKSTCLDHIDDIADDAFREKIKEARERINKRYQAIFTAIRAQQDGVRNDERAGYRDYEKTLEDLGKWFAQRATAITGPSDSVSQAPVLFNASEVFPDRFYLNTVEGAGIGSNYVANARSFQKAWGLTAIEITSLEELFDDAIRRQSHPKRVRIVTHGQIESMRIRIFKDGFLELSLEVFETVLEGTLPLFRYLIGMARFDERPAAARLAAAIRKDARAVEPVATFGLDRPTRIVAAFLLYEAILRSKAYESSAGADSALVKASLEAITKLLRARLRSIYGVDAAAVGKLRQAIKRAVAAGPSGLKLDSVKFNSLEKADLKGMVRFLATHPSLEVRIRQFRRAIGQKQPYVDIRGCQVGLSRPILRSTAKLFATTPSRVTAPDFLLGFAAFDRHPAVSLECDLPTFLPIPALVEQANAPEQKDAHSPPWTALDYLTNYARFLGQTRWERGWLFLSGHKAWKDLAPQIKAAEVLYFIPFFVWLAENPLPAGTTLPSGATTITEFRVYLDYLFDCLKRDAKPAMRKLLRTCWADAPAARVEKLVTDIMATGSTTAPSLPMLDTGMLANIRPGSRLKLGQYSLPYDPAFRASISRGS
jgi:hypothetical protein